ncbi:MAG: DsbA family protein [Nitrosopumilus sp.]|nr:DsbA family protein [Nitrosopumilus sp.]MDH3516054.1 DsbA family protein [Nitrosopumilus sp.]MDH3564541.1 DsbA family protein [Nitrosopumilus sp.]MDH5554716.1 DsbA family protein [Nitrosopumilus sp.]
MGKRNRKTKPSENSKTKFIIIGIIAVVIAVGITAAAMNPDSIKADNPRATKLSLDTRNGSPVLGDLSSPVTIIEFGDYQCPFCKRWNENTKPVIVQNLIETGKVSLIYVDFAIIGPDSITIHAGSYCAAEQDLYWEYHDFVYANQGHENDGWANSENLKLLVTGINGLDVDSFNECLDSKKYEQQVNENKKIASDAGVRSTPTFIIIPQEGQAEMITGAQPYGTFKVLVDEMLG